MAKCLRAPDRQRIFKNGKVVEQLQFQYIQLLVVGFGKALSSKNALKNVGTHFSFILSRATHFLLAAAMCWQNRSVVERESSIVYMICWKYLIPKISQSPVALWLSGRASVLRTEVSGLVPGGTFNIIYVSCGAEHRSWNYLFCSSP